MVIRFIQKLFDNMLLITEKNGKNGITVKAKYPSTGTPKTSIRERDIEEKRRSFWVYNLEFDICPL